MIKRIIYYLIIIVLFIFLVNFLKWYVCMLIIVGIIIASIIWSIVQWLRNNAQPEIPAEVRVVSVDDRNNGIFVLSGTDYLLNLSRGYYITYEFLSSGKRKKVWVPFIYLADERDMLVEGDIGVLTLQGTRYISFRPTNSSRHIDN